MLLNVRPRRSPVRLFDEQQTAAELLAARGRRDSRLSARRRRHIFGWDDTDRTRVRRLISRPAQKQEQTSSLGLAQGEGVV